MEVKYLSGLDEASVFPEQMFVVSSENEVLTLMSVDGNKQDYIDMMSAYGSVNFGHCNSDIAPYEGLDSDIAACFYPKEAYSFSKWICNKVFEDTPAKVLFQVGGSFAVSSAISISQRKKPGKILAVAGAFHGLGTDALAVTDTQKEIALQNTISNRSFRANVDFIEPGEFPKNIEEYSCFIFEPIQGANGYVPLDRAWLNDICQMAKSANVVVIADEVQAGFYRHGHLSVAKYNDLHVDIYLFSKSLTNGQFPLSAVVYRESIVPKETLSLAHTFQTSAIGVRAAHMVSRFIDSNDIDKYCNTIESYLLTCSDELKKVESIKDIHVCKTTLSFDIGERSSQLVKSCFENNVLIFSGGKYGTRVRIAPPLTISEETLETTLEKIVKIVKEL
jgi:4-aminobutyrate aminotransferase-like enzyme